MTFIHASSREMLSPMEGGLVPRFRGGVGRGIGGLVAIQKRCIQCTWTVEEEVQITEKDSILSF